MDVQMTCVNDLCRPLPVSIRTWFSKTREHVVLVSQQCWNELSKMCTPFLKRVLMCTFCIHVYIEADTNNTNRNRTNRNRSWSAQTDAEPNRNRTNRTSETNRANRNRTNRNRSTGTVWKRIRPNRNRIRTATEPEPNEPETNES